MAEIRTTSSTGGQKGVKLERFDLIPTGPLAELAEHYGVGASKYANHQWRNGYEWSKSYAAMVRHQNAFWAGYDYDVCSNDPEGCSHVDAEGRPFVAIREDACFNHTGSHHMAAVAWHAFCLLEFKDSFPEHDDRYKPPTTEPEETFSRMWVMPNMEMTIQEITPEQVAIITGRAVAPQGDWTDLGFTDDFGPLGYSEARFSMSIQTGDTDDLNPLALLNEAIQTRD